MDRSLFFLCTLEILLAALTVFAAWAYYHNQGSAIGRLKSEGKVAEIRKILANPARKSKHRDAIQALGELRDLDSATLLAAALEGPHAAEARRALQRLGEPAVAPLLGLLQPGPEQARARAGLVAIGPAAIPSLKNALLDEARPEPARLLSGLLAELKWEPEANEFGAAYWLAERQPLKCASIGSAAVPRLLKALTDPALAPAAMQALGAIGDPRAVDPLLDLGCDERTQAEAIAALVKIGLPGAPFLVSALPGPDPLRAACAAVVLQAISWQPGSDRTAVLYWMILGDWERVVASGPAAVDPLSEALARPDRELRTQVIAALGQIGGPEAGEALTVALKDPDPALRRLAVQALARTHSERALPALIEALADPETQAEASAALAHFGQAAVSPLISALSHPDWEVKRAAARALAGLGWNPALNEPGAYFLVALGQWETCEKFGPLAFNPLVSALSDDELRPPAVRLLGRLGDPRAVAPLLARMQVETGRPARRDLARAIGQIGQPAIEPIVQALQDRSLDPTLAVLTLGLIGSSQAIEPLIKILKDRDTGWQTRRVAAHALGQIGIPAVYPLIELIRARNIEPRLVDLAAIALAKIGKSAVLPLIRAISEKNVDLQSALTALGKIGDERALGAVVSVLKSRQFGGKARLAAIQALGNMGEKGVPHLIEALQGPTGELETVRLALRTVGGAAIDPLLAALKHSSEDGREEIVRALAYIDDPRAIQALRGLLSDRRLNKIALEAIQKVHSAHQPPASLGMDIRDAPRGGEEEDLSAASE